MSTITGRFIPIQAFIRFLPMFISFLSFSPQLRDLYPIIVSVFVTCEVWRGHRGTSDVAGVTFMSSHWIMVIWDGAAAVMVKAD